jgi:hypothetical protein
MKIAITLTALALTLSVSSLSPVQAYPYGSPLPSDCVGDLWQAMARGESCKEDPKPASGDTTNVNVNAPVNNSVSNDVNVRTDSKSNASAIGTGGNANAVGGNSVASSVSSGGAGGLGGTSNASVTGGNVTNQVINPRQYRSGVSQFLQVPQFSGIFNIGVIGGVDNDGYQIGVGISTALGAPSYKESREFDIRQAEAGRSQVIVNNNTQAPVPSVPVQVVPERAVVPPAVNTPDTDICLSPKNFKSNKQYFATCSGRG